MLCKHLRCGTVFMSLGLNPVVYALRRTKGETDPHKKYPNSKLDPYSSKYCPTRSMKNDLYILVVD